MKFVESASSPIIVTVVDYGQNLVTPQNELVILEKTESLSVLTGAYDLVIASAVIEHYPSARLLLEQLLQRTNPGGIFYARTPHMLPIMGLFRLFGISIDFTYPGHVHDLGQTFWEGIFAKEYANTFQILESRPSIVETTLRKHFLRTVAAYSFKAPWYLLGKSYKHVGGWEIFARRNPA
jgi:SAM-dependent methyltransferase